MAMDVREGLGNAVKAFAAFLIIEFVIIAFCMLCMGAFTDAPLEFVTDMAVTYGTTPSAFAVAFFTVGTFINLIVMFVMAVKHQGLFR